MERNVELGLDTFGDVTAAADGALLPHAQVIRNVDRRRQCWPTRSAWTSSASASITARDFAVSAPEVVLAAIAGADHTHPPRLGRDRAEFGRSGPRVPALRDAGRRLERTGGSHPRPRLVHRILPAVRLRPVATTRRCSRRSSTCSPPCAQGGPVTWQGTAAARRSTTSAVFPPIEAGPLRTWVGVGGSPQSVVRAARYGLPLMLAIIGGDPRALPPVRRPVPSRLCAARPAARSRSACIRPATSPTPTSRRARNCGRTTRP